LKRTNKTLTAKQLITTFHAACECCCLVALDCSNANAATLTECVIVTCRVNDASTLSCTTFEIVLSSRTAQTAVYRAMSSFSRTRTRLSFQTLYLGCRQLLQTTIVQMWTVRQGQCTDDAAELLMFAVHTSCKCACSAMIWLSR